MVTPYVSTLRGFLFTIMHLSRFRKRHKKVDKSSFTFTLLQFLSSYTFTLCS